VSDAATQTEPCEHKDDEFLIRGGRRYALPYQFDFRTFTKRRWVGRTLLDVFTKDFPHQPADYFERAIAAGRLTVRDRAVLPGTPLIDGDWITHHVHRHEPSVPEPAVRVIERDHGGIVAVEKVGGIPVHPCGRYRRNTLQYLLGALHGLPDLCVAHRLDVVTSGVVLLARTPEAAEELSRRFRERDISKEYLARVAGAFPPSASCEAALEVADNASRQVSVSTGRKAKPAATAFALVAHVGDGTSVVLCRPRTGRTHQIRVHLQHLGHPIHDDPLYGPAQSADAAVAQRRSGVIDEAPVAAAAAASATTACCGVDTSLDDVCAHCPGLEPKDSLGRFGARSGAAAADHICLHALRYFCEDFQFEAAIPGWAAEHASAADVAAARATLE